jgi:hypothetical protein
VIRKTLVLAAGSTAVITSVLAVALAPISSANTVPSNCPAGTANPIYCSRPQITATMQWTFLDTPTYTKVLGLVVNGASLTTVAVDCHGRGCPYARHTTLVHTTRPCGKNGKRRCRTFGTLDLTPGFRKHRLSVGTKLSVAITRPGWIGKYYLFTVRSAKGPRADITAR